MMFFILQALYLMAPAYVANMAPVFCKGIPYLSKPVDAGIMLRGKRLFGAHKTWRGVVCAVIAGIVAAFIQYLLQPHVAALNLVDYAFWPQIGFLLGLGAIGGDLAESMIKRRLDIKDGSSFFPFDQVDYAVGALLFLSLYFVPPLKVVMTGIVSALVFNPLVTHVAYYLKMREAKW